MLSRKAASIANFNLYQAGHGSRHLAAQFGNLPFLACASSNFSLLTGSKAGLRSQTKFTNKTSLTDIPTREHHGDMREHLGLKMEVLSPPKIEPQFLMRATDGYVSFQNKLK